jgi:small conductance mechanosensitive channel
VIRVFTTDFWIKAAQDAGAHVLSAALEIILIIILLLAARFLVFRLIGRCMDAIVAREKGLGNAEAAGRARTLSGLLRSVTGYVLVFIAGVMLLRALGTDPLPLLTTAGVLGLAVGFGAQKLVRDVISGFFILLENQYTVGEYVTIGVLTGVVEEIGMRTTRIRGEDGRLSIISNGDITQVTNHSRGAMLASVDVSVAAGSDLEQVCKVLRTVGAQIAEERADVLGHFTCDGLAAMDGSKVTLRLVGRVDPASQDQVQMDLRSRVRDAFEQNGITLA